MKDPIAELEQLLEKSGQGKHVLRLYIAGNTPQSSRAVANIKKLCEERLKDRYELNVIDLYQSPEDAKDEQIVVTPTLVKQLPLPLRRVVGDFSNINRVLLVLDINPETPPETP